MLKKKLQSIIFVSINASNKDKGSGRKEQQIPRYSMNTKKNVSLSQNIHSIDLMVMDLYIKQYFKYI